MALSTTVYIVNLGTPPNATDGDTNRQAHVKLNQFYTDAIPVINANQLGLASLNSDQRFLNRGKRNLLINGNLLINQRLFGGGTVAANTYCYDRWRTFGAASSITRTDQSISINGTIGQIIESPNAGGATLTISVYNPSGPITINLRPDATTTGVSGVIAAGAGLQSLTLTVPSSITGNLFVQLTTSSAVTIDGYAKRGGIQIEYGSFASAFEYFSMGEEFQRCFRYFQKSFPYLTNLANNQQGVILRATAFSANNAIITVDLAVLMRVAPSIGTYSPSVNNAGGQFAALINGSWVAGTGISAFNTSEKQISWTSGFANLPIYASAYVQGNWVADAEL